MLNPEIELEKMLSSQIYEALHGKMVEDILENSSFNGGGRDYWKNVMEGHSFKVEKRLMSHLYDLFYDVKKTLGYEENIDFYITGSSQVNAFSVTASKKGQPHIINVNSGLIDLMTDEELRFVIGHEIGHLMNKDSELLKLIHFIFPPGTNRPLVLQYKIRLWEQLAELVADRYGYMAIPNLGVCVSAFFKLASGLNLNKINMQMDVFIEENLKHLEFFRTGEGLNTEDHPVNPVRIQSLNLYANCKSNEDLKKNMEDIVQILLRIRTTELDHYLGLYIATAGLMVASADEGITEKEAEHILGNLSAFEMFPRNYLDQIAQKNVQELFMLSVTKIMEINPGMRDTLYDYMIGIVLSDKKINQKEVEFLYMAGENLFGYSKKEMCDKLAVAIQQNFVPSFDAIC